MRSPSEHLRSALAVAALVLGACLSLPKPEPIRLFTIDPRLEGEPSFGPGPALLVSAPRAGPGLEGPRILYVKAPNQPEYFARSQWVEPPARMLGAALARALERTGRFQAVTEVALGSRPGLRLESEVVKLQQEFMDRPIGTDEVNQERLSDFVGDALMIKEQLHVIGITWMLSIQAGTDLAPINIGKG